MSATDHPDHEVAFHHLAGAVLGGAWSDGYTGTLAEKSSAVRFPRNGACLDGLSRDVILRALGITDAVIRQYGDGVEAAFAPEDIDPTPDALIAQRPHLAEEAREARGLALDKHGPAVGFLHRGEWVFVGFAPC